MSIDTESPLTLLSNELLDMIGVKSSDLSRVDSILHTADGNKMNIKGKINCKMTIDKISLEYPVIFTQLSKLSGIV